MPNLQNEFEIKLSIPNEKLKSLESFIISKGGLRRQRLQAFYIDTDDFLMAKSGIALRIRKEGRFWIQTLKALGANQFERLEHNVSLQAWDPEHPLIDLALHMDHPAGKVLKKTLGKKVQHTLSVRYQTDIWRRRVEVKSRNLRLEYALDRGLIKSIQRDGTQLHLPVQEIEVELLEGDTCAVIPHIKTLINRFKAYIDIRSKAQRGFYLSLGKLYGDPVRSELTKLSGYLDHQIVSSIVDDCLGQILSNMSEINAGTEDYDEYLHQLRVGLRRLKTALKIISLDDIFLDPAELDVLSAIFLKLGLYRDSNYLYEKLNPALLEVDGPTLDLGHHEKHAHPRIFLSDKSFQLFLLNLIELVLQKQKEPAIKGNTVLESEESVKPVMLKVKILNMLGKIHRDTRKTAKHFLVLPEAERHELRKKLKRFRYSLEFFSEFADRKKYALFMKQLKKVLEHLGDYNDICVAIDYINSSLVQPTPHWFALGWLKAEQKRVEHLSSIALDEFFMLKKVW